MIRVDLNTRRCDALVEEAEIARRLAMSESDLYRKQRTAVAAVARTLAEMEAECALGGASEPSNERRMIAGIVGEEVRHG